LQEFLQISCKSPEVLDSSASLPATRRIRLPTMSQYAAECVSMSQRHENMNEKALFLEMATKWLRLAEFAERNEGAVMNPRFCEAQERSSS
jgi:hypothetical protein